MKLLNQITNKEGVCELFLYGEISSYGENFSSDFIQTMNEISQKATRCKIRMNTPGGEVFEGLVIFQCVKNCKIPVDIYIDGMCASIGSIIAMAVPKENLFISKYGAIMTHKPSCGTYGNADDLSSTAKMVKDLEDILVNIYVERTGKPVDYVKQNWITNKDVWFTANDALSIGLVGGIFDGDIITVPTQSHIKDKNQLWNFYNQLTNKSIMNKLLITMRSHFGMPDDATEEMVLARFKETMNVNNSLTAKVTNLEQVVNAFKEKEVEAKKEAVKMLVDVAIQNRKFTEELRASYTEMATQNFDTTKKIIDAMPTIGKITDMINQGVQNNVERANWTWDDYHQKDPKALENKKAYDKADYSRLFEAKFGVKPNN